MSQGIGGGEVNPDEMQELMRDLFQGQHEPRLDIGSLEAILEQPNYRLFTAEQGGKTVAMASFYTINLPSRCLGVIEEVVTLTPYRNQGFGSNLVLQALGEAQRQKLDCVELTVRQDRPEVRAFYEHLGFVDRRQHAMRLCIAR
jgi:ribosomal protein S18 acetylase RimI-like enzyme